MGQELDLSDAWSANGTSMSEYSQITSRLQEATQFIRIHPDEISFIYGLGESRDSYRVRQFSYYSLLHHEEQMRYFVEHPAASGREYFYPKKDLYLPLAEESFHQTGCIISRKGDKDPIYVTAKAKHSLCRMAGLAGERTAENTLYMTEEICKALGDKKTEITLVMRAAADRETGETLHKVFSAVSGKYTPVPASVIESCIRVLSESGEFGRISVERWHITHHLNRMHVEFPEMQKVMEGQGALIPGLELSTSDTGNSCFIIRQTFRFTDCGEYVTGKEFALRHSGADIKPRLQVDNLQKVIRGLLKDWDTIRDTIGLLAQIPLPAASTAAGREKLFRSVCKELQLTSIIGVKRKAALIPLIVRQSQTDAFTQYGLVHQVMKLPDMVQLKSTDLSDRLRAAAGQALLARTVNR